MPDSSNTPEIYERVVKIKELPMKTSVTPDSVLLIEDDEDTKQMPVQAFYDLIDDKTTYAMELVRAKLTEVDSYLETVKEATDGLTEAEAERVKAEQQRQQNEADRQNTFNQWSSTINDVWRPEIEDAIEQEAVRQSNETYRTNLFSQWLEMISQWERAEQDRVSAEQDRQSAESDREEAESTRQDNEQDRITQFNNLKIEIQEAIDNANSAGEGASSTIENAINNMQSTINNHIQTSNATINNYITNADKEIDDAIAGMNNSANTAINNANEAATNANNAADKAEQDVANAIADMNATLESILEQIQGGMEVSVPVGTTLFSTSSSTAFFSNCFGGTWVVVGNIDTIVVSSGTALTLYLHRKTAN